MALRRKRDPGTSTFFQLAPSYSNRAPWSPTAQPPVVADDGQVVHARDVGDVDFFPVLAVPSRKEAFPDHPPGVRRRELHGVDAFPGPPGSWRSTTSGRPNGSVDRPGCRRSSGPAPRSRRPTAALPMPCAGTGDCPPASTPCRRSAGTRRRRRRPRRRRRRSPRISSGSPWRGAPRVSAAFHPSGAGVRHSRRRRRCFGRGWRWR